MLKIIFDIGANDGSSTLQMAIDRPDCLVVAFEPTPRMVRIIQDKIQSMNLKNYLIVQKAVSNYNGKAKFFVAGQSDWGCSSLNTFNTNLETNWPGRTDFRVTDEIEVEVTRLDAWIDQHIKTDFIIEYLHCDVQGSDLEVLQGLGGYCNRRVMKEGVIEMPISHEKKLYQNQKYTVADAIVFLTDRGYYITRLEANDGQGNEYNVYFSS